jgi:hypothetical protein
MKTEILGLEERMEDITPNSLDLLQYTGEHV